MKPGYSNATAQTIAAMAGAIVDTDNKEYFLPPYPTLDPAEAKPKAAE